MAETRRGGRALRALLVMGVVGGLVGLVFLAGGNVWVLRWAAPRIHDSIATLPRAAVAIVPGAQVYGNRTPSIQLEDRLATALELYRAGKVGAVLVSGARYADGYDEPGVMATWLLAHGLPRAAIHVDGQGFRTIATMVRAARVYGVREAIICTQRYHLPRALVQAHQAGIDAQGLVADRQPYPGQWIRYTTREMLARPMMLLEIAVLGMRAEGLDQRRPIRGGGGGGGG
jgi:SanA protein